MSSAPRVFIPLRHASNPIRSGGCFFLLCVLAAPQTLFAFSGAGAGTQASPFLITNVTQLQEMATSPAACYVLANDIDATSTSLWNDGGTGADILEGFLPVGTTEAPFTGSLDGAGHRITGLRIDRQTRDNVGLFGRVGGGAAIRNVTLESVTIKGFSLTGALAGFLATTQTVSNCHAASGTVTGNTSVGGLAGENHAPLSDCSSGASAQGQYDLGGLIGSHYGATVARCHATGKVSTLAKGARIGGLIGRNEGTAILCHAAGDGSAYEVVGGLVGQNKGALARCHATGATSAFFNAAGLVAVNNGSIEYCHASGAATGDYGSGGLATQNTGAISNSYATGAVSSIHGSGGLVDNNEGTLSRCYSAGPVSAGFAADAGGLVRSNSGTVTDSLWDIEASGQSASAAGVGKSTADMMRRSTFEPPWDFAGVWGIVEDKTYPFFIEDGPPRPGVGPADIGVSPSSHDFGARLVGQGPGTTRTVGIYNLGAEPLTGISVSLIGRDWHDFTIVSDTGEDTLTGEGARIIVIAFDPADTGPRGAALVVFSDDPDDPVALVTLLGEGLDSASILNHLLGVEPLTGAGLAGADANGDGRIDVADIAAFGLLSGAAPPRKVDRAARARLDRP